MGSFIAPNIRKYFVRSHVLGSANKIRTPGRAIKGGRVYLPAPKKCVTRNSFFTTLNTMQPPMSAGLRGVDAKYAHTDIKYPNFDKYREESTNNPEQKSSKSLDGRRIKSGAVTFATCVISLYGTKAVALHFIKSMAASAEVLALAKIEVKLQEIPEGKNAVFKWRGKPLFVKHRTQEEIAFERATPVASLRDPETDEARCKVPEWLVIIGVCTHLGCIPISNQGDFPGGYYCPCHGSHYDSAGRIRKGPAPLNMEIPEHTFLDANTLLVG